MYSKELLWNDAPIVGGGGGVTTLGPVGNAPNADGGTITGSNLTLQPCNASFPGLLVTGDQDIPTGTKTFQNNVQLPATTNTGSGGVMRIGNTRIHNYSPYSGVKNLFIGENAGNFSTTGSYNTGIGTDCYPDLTTGGSNFWAGHGTCSLTTGGFNTAISGGANLTTGSRNLIMGGVAPGNAYTGNESDNICISNQGFAGESKIIRIGDSNIHTTVYLAGVAALDPGQLNNPNSSPLIVDSGYDSNGGWKLVSPTYNQFLSRLLNPNPAGVSIHNIYINANPVTDGEQFGLNATDTIMIVTGDATTSYPAGSNNLIIGKDAGANGNFYFTNSVLIRNRGPPNVGNTPISGNICIGNTDCNTACYVAGIAHDPMTGTPPAGGFLWVDQSKTIDGAPQIKYLTVAEMKTVLGLP